MTIDARRDTIADDESDASSSSSSIDSADGFARSIDIDDDDADDDIISLTASDTTHSDLVTVTFLSLLSLLNSLSLVFSRKGSIDDD